MRFFAENDGVIVLVKTDASANTYQTYESDAKVGGIPVSKGVPLVEAHLGVGSWRRWRSIHSPGRRLSAHGTSIAITVPFLSFTSEQVAFGAVYGRQLFGSWIRGRGRIIFRDVALAVMRFGVQQ